MRVWKEVIDGVDVEVMEFDNSVETVEKASELSGHPRSAIVKTLLLKVGEEYLVAVIRGDRRLDLNKAGKVLGKKVRLAKPDEVATVLGTEIGAVTPFSPKVRSLQVILDPVVLNQEFVICGGGSLNRLYKVEVGDLVKCLKPLVVDVFK